MSSFYQWLDDRTGVRRISRALLDEPIRGGARFAYIFGSVLVFLFLLQGLTGIFLAMYYVPSSDHAHASVAYIQKVVTMGGLVRGLHYYGASAMILFVLAHLVQTFLFGAYKQRRELLWIVGILMMLVVLTFGFTGYLLPWDQEAYFGTKVGTGVAGEVPVAGEWMQRILLGGRDLTTVTLSRFFIIHIFLLPLSLLFFLVIHLYFFRRAGAAGPFHQKDNARVDLFYPNQLFKDTLAVFAVFVLLLLLALTIPASLGPEADPTADFLARPPWYFLPLFELLKYFPGKLALIPSIGLPLVLLGTMFLLPFVDKRSERHPARRPFAMLTLVLALGGGAALMALSKYQDAANPQFHAKLKAQQEEAKIFLNAPFFQQEIGRTVPIHPPTVINPLIAGSRVLKIFAANCANCHGANALGGPFAPSLVNLAKSRNLTQSFLVEYLAGHKREAAPGSMPKFAQLTPEDRDAIAAWLLTLHEPIEVRVPESTPALRLRTTKTVGKPFSPRSTNVAAPAPPAAFTANCAFCHGADGEGNIGPRLKGITERPDRAPDDIVKILTNSRQFGLKDPMPSSFPKLSDQDRNAIAEWLSKLH